MWVVNRQEEIERRGREERRAQSKEIDKERCCRETDVKRERGGPFQGVSIRCGSRLEGWMDSSCLHSHSAHLPHTGTKTYKMRDREKGREQGESERESDEKLV